MPEEITQKLGFDASKAITALSSLKTSLNELRTSLDETARSAREFQDKSRPMLTALREIKTAANSAKTALGGLGVAPAAAATSIRGASDSLGTFAQNSNAAIGTSQHLAGAFNTTSTQATTAGTSVAKAGDAMREAGKKGKQAGTDITVSWKTVLRVVQAQFIVRSLAQITSAFAESQHAAQEFSIAVAEAFTISGGQLGSMEQMNKSVLELANNLGLTAAEVAEGTYQTLSNQVTDAADALQFADEAAKLSIATQTDLKTAVNALSSVMNSYNLDVSETSRVSDILFKTIEFGRLRLDEFGDVLGRLSPLTAELGISYEEMAASIAALTQKGVPAHTAITQLTQVSQKLLRPTEGLKNLYEEWMGEGGSGPEAIKRFGGLTGVLLKMKDATAGNDAEFANLLGRVRSIVGALNLTSDGASAVIEVMDDMENSMGVAAEAAETMNEAIGRESVIAWNQLGNAMLDAGASLLRVTTPMVEGVVALVNNMDQLVVIAGGAVGALALYRVAALRATTSTLGWTVSVAGLKAALATLLPVMLAVAAAWFGVQIGKFLNDSLDKASEATARAKELDEALTKTHDAETQKRVQATRKEFQELRKLTGEGFSEMSKQYQKDLDLLRASSKGVGATLEGTLEHLLGLRQDAVKTIKDTLLEVDSAIKESMDEVRATQKSITDDAFERDQKGLSEQAQLWREIERATETGSDARRDYASAGADEAKTTAARELSHIAERQAQEAVSHAERIGNINDIKKAEQALNLIRANRIRAEVTFQLKRKDLQTEVHRDRLSQIEEEGVKLKELLELVKELSDPVTSQGALKSIETRRKDAERIAELAPEIEAQLERAFDFTLFEKLGVADSMDQLKTGVQDALDKARFDWARELDDFQNRIGARNFKAPVTLEIANEYIIEEFVKKFGDLDPLGDPGKFGSRLQGVLEETVAKYEGLQEVIDQGNETALLKVEAALTSLTKDEWFTWWDAVKSATADGLTSLGEAELRAAGMSEEALKNMEEAIPASEQLRQKLLDTGAVIKSAINDQRNLTKAERESVNEILVYATKIQEAGELSKNAGNQGNKAFKEMVESIGALETALNALNEQNEITPGAYEDALNALSEMRDQAKEAEAAQGEVTAEATETGKELDKAKGAQVAMPAAASQATSALAAEKEAAAGIRIELEGAVQAQRDLAQGQLTGGGTDGATPTTPGTPAAPVQPTGPSAAELSAQAAAARQLADEIANAGRLTDQLGQVLTALPEAFNAPIEASASMGHNLELANEDIISMGLNFPLVTEQINLAKLSVDGLAASLLTTQTATTDLITSTSSWKTMLEGCASAGQAAAAAMYAAAAAARAAAAACAAASAQCSGGSVQASKGGRFFANGGRGTDTIPAWLTPGEFVMNAKSTRRFFPQLQAMNAGAKPTFRESGGSVTNVGDIHMSIQGGDSSSQTVREIAHGLRRELRRKTIRLN